jgi:glycosyltransferase involved in cell wall biosynthesis
MKILIVEPDASGHHFIPYLLFLARRLLANGVELRLMTTQSALEHPAYQMLQQQLSGCMAVSVMPEIRNRGGRLLGLLQRQFDYHRAVSAGFNALPENARPDHVIVLSMDGMDRATVLRGSPFGRTSFSGLFVHLKFHWQSLGVAPSGRFPKVQEFLLERLLRKKTVSAMATIDGSLPKWWQARHSDTAEKLRYVPDPGQVRLLESKQQARAALGIAPTQFFVLVYGEISSKKNVAALLAATEHCKQDLHIILAGTINADIKHLLTSSTTVSALIEAGKLRIFGNYADLHFEQRLFAAADLAWLGYEKAATGQSAVLAQAASAGVPVLARQGGWIGWMTQQHRLGECVDAEDPRAVAAAITKLHCNDDLMEAYRKAGLQFAKARSEIAFTDAFLGCLPEFSA